MTLVRRTRVAITAEEASPGVPYWGPNQIVTDVADGETNVAFENLVANTTYYVRTWTEDAFGQTSPYIDRVIKTPPDPTIPATPTGLTLTAISFGFKAVWAANTEADLAEYELAYAEDDGSLTGPGTEATFTTIKSKTTHQTVEATVGQMLWVKVRALDFSGNASDYTGLAEVTPFQRVPLLFGGPGFFDSGSSCSVYFKVPDTITAVEDAQVSLAFREFQSTASSASSGGGSTSGASSSSTSGSESAHWHTFGQWQSDVLPAMTTRNFSVGGVSGGFELPTSISGQDVLTFAGTAHDHGIAHTHTTPAHVHALTYGTYEEAYPASHSATLKVYKRVAGAWVLQHTYSGLTADLEDVDITAVVTGAGDWKLTVISAAAQPNGGRLGVDVFGSISAIMGGPDVLGATTVPGATYIAGSLWVGGVEVFDETGALLVGAAPTGAAGGDLAGSYPNPTVVDDSHNHSASTLTDAELSAIAALVSAADSLPYFTGSGTAALATFTTFARTLLDDTTAAAMRTTLGVSASGATGDAELDAIAGLVSAADRLPYFTGSGLASLTVFTAAGRALIDDADATAQRTTLGLGSFATISSLAHASTTGITATDHHAAPVAGPDADITIDAAGATGTASTFARSGHGHKLITSANVAVALGAAAAGTSGHSPSRDDHVHPTTGLSLTGHGAADHADITRSLFLNAEDATLDAGTFATLGAAPNQTRVVALADAATQAAVWMFVIPADWASGVITAQPIWVPGSTDAVAHTVRWQLDTRKLTAGTDVTAAATASAFTGASAARTANLIVYDTATSTTLTPTAAGEVWGIHVERVGASASDTYVGVVNLVGVLLTYTANQ